MQADYEDYTSTATADLPDEINRLLDRAEDLIDYSIRDNGNPKQTDLSSDSSSGQADLLVEDGNVFDEGDGITVLDDDANETGTIDSITIESYGADTVTLEENLSNAYTTAARAYVKKTDPADWYLKQRHAFRDATCAQVEYWEEAFGEGYGIAGSVDSFAIGNLRMSFLGGGSTLSPRSYRHLKTYGLIYSGVGQKSGTTEDFIANDPRID